MGRLSDTHLKASCRRHLRSCIRYPITTLADLQRHHTLGRESWHACCCEAHVRSCSEWSTTGAQGVLALEEMFCPVLG